MPLCKDYALIDIGVLAHVRLPWLVAGKHSMNVEPLRQLVGSVPSSVFLPARVLQLSLLVK